MAVPFYQPIDLNLLELLNALLQNLASNPTNKESQIYYNTATKTVRFYNGSAWVDLGTLDQIGKALASVDLNNQRIINLADPVGAQDAVNLRFLQSMISGLSSRAEVAYATAAALPANTYANGSGGVGATLTANANGALSVDGQAVVVGQRILVKDEVSTLKNGIYTVTATGSASALYVLTRAIDADQAAEIGPGLLIPVEAPSGSTAGTVNNQKIFISMAPSPFVVGTDGITFGLVGSSYVADETTIHLSGNTFSLIVPVALASGGTGATTAAGARTNLVVPGAFSQTIGDAVAMSFNVDHNLNSKDVVVQVRRLSDDKQVYVDVVASTVNRVVVSFALPPATNAYRVTCHVGP